MKTLKDYILEMETIKYEIQGCDNLIEFYKKKKESLIKVLEALEEKEID